VPGCRLAFTAANAGPGLRAVTRDVPVSSGPKVLIRKILVLWIDSIQAGLEVTVELLP